MAGLVNKRKLYSLRKFLLRVSCCMGISYRVYPYSIPYRVYPYSIPYRVYPYGIPHQGIQHWLFRVPK